MPDNRPVMWVHGNDLVLTIESPAGPIYRQTLPLATLMTRAFGAEVLRWTWDITDPEDGTVSRGAARLLVEEIPDPRQAAEGEACAVCGGSPHMPQPENPGIPYHRYVAPGEAEEQPATPVDATALEGRKRVQPAGQPFPGFPSLTVERQSGPCAHILVDGLGSTPTLCGKPLRLYTMCARPAEHDGDCGPRDQPATPVDATAPDGPMFDQPPFH